MGEIESIKIRPKNLKHRQVIALEQINDSLKILVKQCI